MQRLSGRSSCILIKVLSELSSRILLLVKTTKPLLDKDVDLIMHEYVSPYLAGGYGGLFHTSST